MPMLNVYNYYLIVLFTFLLITIFHILYKENKLLEIQKFNYIINKINKL